MASPDVIDDLLSSDPNQPATNGVVILLRTEMKSDFKSVRSDIERLDRRMDGLDQKVAKIERSVDLIAQQTLQLLDRR